MAQMPPPPVFAFPFVRGNDLNLTHDALDFLQKLWALATEGVIQPFYGSAPGVPGSSAVLGSWIMTGSEQFAAGLPDNTGLVTTAATADWTALLMVTPVSTGTPTTIGTAFVPAGGTVMTWAMAQDYDASAYDVLSFVAPAGVDATLAGIYFTLVATLG